MNRPDVDTWYVLADGTKAHPADVSADEAGVLKHSSGVPVALRENGLPLSSLRATRSRNCGKLGTCKLRVRTPVARPSWHGD